MRTASCARKQVGRPCRSFCGKILWPPTLPCETLLACAGDSDRQCRVSARPRTADPVSYASRLSRSRTVGVTLGCLWRVAATSDRSPGLCPAVLRAGVLFRASAAARSCSFPCPPVLRGSCFCPLTPSYHQPPRPMAGKPGPARQAALWHKAGMPVLRSGGCSWFVYGTSSGYP